MTVADHIDAIKKEMANVTNQLTANKGEMERGRQEVAQLQLNIQQVNQDPSTQQELQKAVETQKRLQEIAVKYLSTIQDTAQATQFAMELEQITKNGQQPHQMAGIPMMNAAVAAAMQNPQMMMRNPMMQAMNSPRVPGKGGVPNGGGANMNGMAMMQQMQMQAMAAQVHAQAQAMMSAQMFPGMPMMVPGMMGGMPPGMAGLPGMMQPTSMAAMQQQYQAFQQMAAAAAANSVAVSTPSRNPSTSGHASRTRTPLTQSATNSPRPTTEPTIKEEDPETENIVVASAAITTSAPSIKQEENPTVAVA